MTIHSTGFAIMTNTTATDAESVVGLAVTLFITPHALPELDESGATPG